MNSDCAWGNNSIKSTFRGVVSSGKNNLASRQLNSKLGFDFTKRSTLAHFWIFCWPHFLINSFCVRSRPKSIREGIFFSWKVDSENEIESFWSGSAFYEFFQFPANENNL